MDLCSVFKITIKSLKLIIRSISLFRMLCFKACYLLKFSLLRLTLFTKNAYLVNFSKTVLLYTFFLHIITFFINLFSEFTINKIHYLEPPLLYYLSVFFIKQFLNEYLRTKNLEDLYVNILYVIQLEMKTKKVPQ